ncbi:outer membrane lipoprotein carrier protein LolA [Sphingomonas lacunae]|uniref:Outer membrane lipoprotein carrier protein LolA n=1 Tax=Sphingomonas lacunae TaxID=2698828 RepID=A0A6M4AQ51_9SPHN|nr:outer membrane lipoprotein carrier protein LolA [Sphingomonas lacunae]QJQ31137.1 outer membrane lipoprotein carrier protein LolA [Sphingomonas lacunae]
MSRLTKTVALLLTGALGLGAFATLPLAQPLAAQTRTAPRATPALTGDLLRVQQHLSAMTSLVADFSQSDRSGQVQNGRLTLRQPGRIRFQYAPGNPLLIVADGRSLTLIDYEVRQVQRWPIRNSPLSVLIDPEANLVRYGRLIDTGDRNTISVEVRDPSRPEYGMITMVFIRDAASPAGLKLYGWVALDAQNQRTSIRLSNQRYNVPVADNMFRWRDPRQTTRGR